ncbi:hypothetical protein E4U57_003608 [Claviceps arundinis]|uniref:adenine phosphoribosyltransferase n=1 Tax=Claviceps arundinis TaxID=1623583 RepID=A0A9P7N085_9HYPO|nr:hypothetical protein E4U57_003608 [Claviceps arundinis]KAG5977196.1 hypothetical protein E4U56_000160 [Claviceps arundinis]
MSGPSSNLPSDLSSSVQTRSAPAHDNNEVISKKQPASSAAAAAELASAKVKLRGHLRQFSDFPVPGIEFIDIMPLFASPDAHTTLVAALEMQIAQTFKNDMPDVIVGLDARGFLFGPGLALRLGIGFAAVRKQGKLPGPCVTAEYIKEYGKDMFQMQQDAIKEGQKVLIVDDIIATGGSAKAAADLVAQLKGQVMGFMFILEISDLNGRDKLGSAPTTILLEFP